MLVQTISEFIVRNCHVTLREVYSFIFIQFYDVHWYFKENIQNFSFFNSNIYILPGLNSFRINFPFLTNYNLIGCIQVKADTHTQTYTHIVQQAEAHAHSAVCLLSWLNAISLTNDIRILIILAMLVK